MKILSIDFDYFQNVAQEVAQNCYPDGIDHPTELSEIIWASHYACDGDKLNAIDILQDELETLERILMNQSSDIPVMVAGSHKHIYDFIYDHFQGGKMKLVNADMHHDLINDNPQLDCGNWLGKVIENQDFKAKDGDVKWIVNPISLSTYGIEDLFGEGGSFNKMIANSFKEYEDEQFDLVFLCRSDIWTPPHLDKYFTELCNIIQDTFDSVIMEKGIDKPRVQYLKYAEQFAESRRTFHIGKD